jgi:hypothetical protein
MGTDISPNNQQYTVLVGATTRIMEVDTVGAVSAVKTTIIGKLSDVTAITLLTTEANWSDAGAYIGTAITGTYEGQYYSNGTYYFFAYSDNAWRRWREDSIGAMIYAATVKTSIVDGDSVAMSDSADTNKGKKITWANIKATLVATIESITGLKTYDKEKFAMKGTSTGSNLISVANTSANNYTNTIPAKTGTFAMTSDLDETVQALTSTSTFTHDCDTYSAGKVTAQAVTLNMAAPTGTPTDMESFIMKIIDNGSAKSISWDAKFRSIGATLPTTTVGGKVMSLVFLYDSDNTTWDLMSIANQP